MPELHSSVQIPVPVQEQDVLSCCKCTHILIIVYMFINKHTSYISQHTHLYFQQSHVYLDKQYQLFFPAHSPNYTTYISHFTHLYFQQSHVYLQTCQLNSISQLTHLWAIPCQLKWARLHGSHSVFPYIGLTPSYLLLLFFFCSNTPR